MAYMLKDMPSMSTILSAYASFSAISMLIRTILNEMIPKKAREFITSKLSELFSSYFSSDFTFLIEDRWHAVENDIYRAVQAYLPTIVDSSARSLLLGNNDPTKKNAVPKSGVPVDVKVVDKFEGMRLEWTLCEKESKKYYVRQKRHFQLKCQRKDREKVMEVYLPHICKVAESILNQRELLNIYTCDHEDSNWESTVFNHPATFDTLAIDPDLKKSIIDDLDLFVQRKDYFKSVGRAWKRGYLLYGPPGTGKSTLVAAIANYLRFNIYDLQLQGVRSDAALRRILTSTTNRSILLIEDIDCSAKTTRTRSPAQKDDKDSDNEEDDFQPDNKLSFDPGVTLSGLLNFIDGLWSTCGDERIIIFTTNHKDKLDPALLRPGRMDVHIYMGYCTPEGFKKLANTYLGVKEHTHFKSIEDLIQRVPITPAEVAQHLMKSNWPEIALEVLIEFLENKEIAIENNKGKEEHDKEVIKQEIVKFRKKDTKQKIDKQENIGMRSIYLT